jgi:hypothetical protein
MFHLNLAFRIVISLIIFGMIGAHQLTYRSAMSDVRANLTSTRSDAANGEGPWRAVGLSEEAARKQAEAQSRAFSPTQPCTHQNAREAKQELQMLEEKLSPKARFRLWLHQEAIKLYLERNPGTLYEQARVTRRDGAPPITCEQTVVALAIARRG